MLGDGIGEKSYFGLGSSQKIDEKNENNFFFVWSFVYFLKNSEKICFCFPFITSSLHSLLEGVFSFLFLSFFFFFFLYFFFIFFFLLSLLK